MPFWCWLRGQAVGILVLIERLPGACRGLWGSSQDKRRVGRRRLCGCVCVPFLSDRRSRCRTENSGIAAESAGGLKTLRPGWRIVTPAGEGAATGALPQDYRTVSRWVGPDEAAAWLAERGTGIPTIAGSNRMYVTELGAAKPGGTGAYE